MISERLRELLKNGESQTLEIKREIPRDTRLIERHISAFANSRGGTIVLGYDWRTGVAGVRLHDAKRLQSAFEKGVYKSICKVEIIHEDGKCLALLKVGKSKDLLFVRDTAYIRCGKHIYTGIWEVRSVLLADFIEEITLRNRNPSPQKVEILKLLKDRKTNCEINLPAGTIMYRSRIICDKSMIANKAPFWGYDADNSFIPPRSVTKDMRANYRYIPYLYCSSLGYTSIAEVRPRLGENVSLAHVQAEESLHLLDFRRLNMRSTMSAKKCQLFADLAMLYSKPVTTEEDAILYIPTQYIAEYVKNIGYDGIVYNSSLTPEFEYANIDESHLLGACNIVVFNYNKCKVVASNVVNVERNAMVCEQIDMDLTRVENLCSPIFNEP